MKKSYPDYLLVLLTAVLVAVGLIMIYSISPVVSRNYFGDEAHRNYFFNSQAMNLLFGIAAFVVMSRFSLDWLKRLSVPLIGISFVLLFLVFIPGIGIELGGAHRWFTLGFTTVQPAEFLKITLPLYLAVWLEKKGELVRTVQNGVVPFTLIVGFVGFAVAVLQKDLGTMLIIFAALVGMFFVAGARLLHLGAFGAASLAAVALLIIAFPHRLSRITTFTNPSADPQGEGYHVNQALIAIGSGGLLGRGLGNSIQLYGYVPAPPTDSIFAIIAEELGFLGAVVVLGLLTALIVRAFRTARFAPDLFLRLFATGLAVTLAGQALLNIAAMLSLVPLTGVPLPFISYGGSSLVISLASMGLLFNISRFLKGEAYTRKTGKRWGLSKALP